MPRLTHAIGTLSFALLTGLSACSVNRQYGAAPPATPGSSEPPTAIGVPAATAFDKGRSAVKPGLARQLNELGKQLEARPTVRLLIVGNGDEGRSDAANRLLAQDRALSVRDYLLARGADITRLTTESRPAGRQLELRIMVPPSAR